MEAENKILKAKVRLQKTSPFFAYLVMNLKISEREEVGSMGVDSKGNCYYNADFVDKITLEELEGVLTHEVLHIVFEHLTRGRNLECQDLMNVACDMVINDLLVTNNIQLPRSKGKDAINLIPYNHSCEFMGVRVNNLNEKTAIQVYYELLKELENQGKIKYVGFDKHIFGEGKETKEETEANKEKWKRAVGEASAFARQKGDLPQGLSLVIDELLNEKVDWKQLLYKYITRTLPFDYTYSRPSKKSISCGVYMPSILRESVEIVVSIDTSGSISKKELTEFMTEINAIAKSFSNLNMKLIVCDSEIKKVYHIGNGHDTEISKIEIFGGGGTSHIPIYEYIKNELPNTKFVINFTDGYTDMPDSEEVKTLWVLCKNGCKDENIDWGEIVRLD